MDSLISSPLDIGFEIVSRIVDWIFLRRIKDFVSENNGFFIHELYVNSAFITKAKWRSFL